MQRKIVVYILHSMGAGAGKDATAAIAAVLEESINELCDRMAERDERRQREEERKAHEEERERQFAEQLALEISRVALRAAMRGDLAGLKATIEAHSEILKAAGGAHAQLLAEAKDAAFQRRDEERERKKAEDKAQREAEAEKRWKEREEAEARKKRASQERLESEARATTELSKLRVLASSSSALAEDSKTAAATALTDAKTGLDSIRKNQKSDQTWLHKPFLLLSKLKKPPAVVEAVFIALVILLRKGEGWEEARVLMVDPSHLVDDMQDALASIEAGERERRGPSKGRTEGCGGCSQGGEPFNCRTDVALPQLARGNARISSGCHTRAGRAPTCIGAAVHWLPTCVERHGAPRGGSCRVRLEAPRRR